MQHLRMSFKRLIILKFFCKIEEFVKIIYFESIFSALFDRFFAVNIDFNLGDRGGCGGCSVLLAGIFAGKPDLVRRLSAY